MAHAVAFHRFGENHRRLTFVLHRTVVRGINFVRIVAATVQTPHVIIGHAGDHFAQLRIFAEEVFAHVRPVACLHHLILAVDDLLHTLDQHPVFVTRQQLVPIAAPNQFEHVPARATEVALKLLNNLAVATHRTVEALQVAVDNEHQVIELFAARHADRAERFGLVHLTVAAKHPNLAAFGIGQATRMQIFEKARLINAHQRAEAHRHRRQLPKIGHQPRMRVARNTLAIDFLTEVIHLLLTQTIEHEGAGVHTRRAVSLDVHQVAAMIGAGCMPEVIEADVIQCGGRRERRNMTAEFEVFFAAAQHHHRRVPAHIAAQLVLHLMIAGALGLKVRGDGVEVRRVRRERRMAAGAACFVEQRLQQEMRPLITFVGDHAVK